MLTNLAVGRLSKMAKGKKQRRRQQVPATKRIAPAEFTSFVASQHQRRRGERILQRRLFEFDEQWSANIEWE